MVRTPSLICPRAGPEPGSALNLPEEPRNGQGWMFRISERSRKKEPEGPWGPTPHCSVKGGVRVRSWGWAGAWDSDLEGALRQAWGDEGGTLGHSVSSGHWNGWEAFFYKLLWVEVRPYPHPTPQSESLGTHRGPSPRVGGKQVTSRAGVEAGAQLPTPAQEQLWPPPGALPFTAQGACSAHAPKYLCSLGLSAMPSHLLPRALRCWPCHMSGSVFPSAEGSLGLQHAKCYGCE